MNRPLFRRLFAPPVSEQLDQEISLHRDLLITEYQQRGLSAAEAETAADRRLGNMVRARAEALATGQMHVARKERTQRVDELWQDFRFAVRSLGRRKEWTAVALLTLALGIGASTAVFSVVNSLLLHPVPYPAPDRVVVVLTYPDAPNGARISMSPLNEMVSAWRGNTRAIEAIEPSSNSDMTWLHAGTPEVTRTTSITPSFLSFAGEHVVLGRNFTAADVVPGAPPVVMLSEQLWRNQFGGNPAVIGTPIILDGRPEVIVGVVPRRLQVIGLGVTRPDLWRPLVTAAHVTLNTVARLRSGATIAMATAELDTLSARAKLASAAEFKSGLERPAEMVNFKSSLLLLAGAVILVLVIASANVAHLLLARGATRQREFAIRTSLGATRLRLFRQLVTESVVLTTGGCIAGLGLGWLGLRLLIAARPDGLSEIDSATLDARVALWAVGTSVLTGILFGVIGGVQSGMGAPHQVLKNGATSATGSRGQHRLRKLLVISEMAMASTLLIGAALLVRSMLVLQSADVGFDAAGLFTVIAPRVSGPPTGQAELNRKVAAGLRTVPGVLGVSIADNAPPSIGVMIGTVEPEGLPAVPGDPYTSYNAVHANFFEFMKIPLVAGSNFTDTTGAQHQAIVSQGFAAKFWPGVSAIGKRFRLDPRQAWFTIVGVARNAALRGATSKLERPMIYLPMTDETRATFMVRVRPGINPMPAIRTMVSALAATLPPPSLSSVQADLDRALARPRFTMLLLTLFTVIAVILAAVGLYGVLSFSVAQRTREIGIRMALGASHHNVLRSVVAGGIGLAATGAAAGVVAAHWATAIISEMLYGVSRTDLTSVLIGTAILLFTAFAACIVPARRAIAVDPVTAIRADA